MKWVLKKTTDENKANLLISECNVPKPIADILLNRGIDTPDILHNFLNPTIEQLSDPFELPGMEKAVDRIISALRKKEKIGIYGDYDVDGVTASALLYHIFTKLGAHICWYIPSRVYDGYGLSKKGIEKLRDQGANLIVTVDCGVSSLTEIEYARSLGLDCVVTDHHELSEELPNASAIINPKIEGSPPSTYYLAGVGVAFKLAQGLYTKLNMDIKSLYEHLDLVALGTASDIVPIRGENRVLLKYGLQIAAKSKKIGLRILLENCGLAGRRLSTATIVFGVGPRINSAARIGSANAPFKLLTTYNFTLATKLSKFLEEENKKRKEIDEDLLNQAEEKLLALDLDDWKKVIVLFDSNWHQGIIGIVAARIVDKYYKPTILLTAENGYVKGSARSVSGFHILDAIKSTQEHIIDAGGHRYAAGVKLDKSKIEDFRNALKKYAEINLPEKLLEKKLYIDAVLHKEDISMEMLKWVEQLAPYGPENMRPVFATSNIEVIGEPRIVGTDHLQFRVMGDRKAYDVIAFGMGEMITKLRAKRTADIAYVLEVSDYFGYDELKLRVKDIKFPE